jgi:XTP/dITP diphosphohydrolase
MRSIVLASSNPGKLREIRRALGELPVAVAALADHAPLDPPAETADTFAENARRKALYYARATGCWCLADDSGLEVDALGGAPGVLSARYAADAVGEGAGRAEFDAANNARLLKALAGVPDERRTARFVCHLALADRQRVLIEASGVLEGLIARRPQGDNGFGYDPVFFLPDLGCTVATLPLDRKNAISHRGRAVRRFVELLKDLLASEGGR